MKNYIKKLSYLFLSLTLLLGACDVEESLTITSPDPAFQLNTPGISNIFLNFALPDNPAFTVNWIDEINTAATYSVEMSIDAEFTTPINLGSTDKNNFTMSVADFNQILNNADVKSFSETAVYMRVNTGSAISNTVLFQVSKFAVEIPSITSPSAGESFVLSDVDPELVASTITWEDPEITATSTVSVSYELQMAVAGTSFATPISIGEVSDLSLDLKHGSLNELVLAAGGTPETASDFDFRIKAAAKTAAGDLFRTSEIVTYSITPYDVALAPALYVVGAGAVDAGWGWDSPVAISCTGTGVYQGNINLTNDAFRLFTDKSLEWASPSFNFPYYADASYTIDANFENAEDGDKNFKFIGTPGTYLLSIDTINKTITLAPEKLQCEFDQLWLVGAGVPDAGWGWASPVSLPCTGAGVYSGSVNFANDAFRFFTDKTLEWASPSFNFPHYFDEGYTIDANFENAEDGDKNLKFVGTPGTYTLTIDTGNKTITLN